jgi:hypothetical protein
VSTLPVPYASVSNVETFDADTRSDQVVGVSLLPISIRTAWRRPQKKRHCLRLEIELV